MAETEEFDGDGVSPSERTTTSSQSEKAPPPCLSRICGSASSCGWSSPSVFGAVLA